MRHVFLNGLTLHRIKKVSEQQEKSASHCVLSHVAREDREINKQQQERPHDSTRAQPLCCYLHAAR